MQCDAALTKVGSVRRTQQAKLFWDTLGVCSFGLNGVKDSMVLTSKSLAQAVGWEGMDTREGFTVGERIANLMRIVYGRRGFRKSDEFDVSPRHLETTAEGTGSERGIAEYLPAMVDDYYRRMGWDVDPGLPTDETLERLAWASFRLPDRGPFSAPSLGFRRGVERRRNGVSSTYSNSRRHTAAIPTNLPAHCRQ